MTTDAPIALRLKSKEAFIEGIERGLADVKAGRTVSHDAAMKVLWEIIDAENWPD